MLTDTEKQLICQHSKDDSSCQQMTSIIEQKELENQHLREKLRQSEALVEALANPPEYALILLNLDGTIATVSDTAAHNMAHTPEDMLQKNAYDFFSVELAKKSQQRINQVIQTGEVLTVEEEYQGEWFNKTIYPVYDADHIMRYVAMHARNITEIREKEEALKRSEQTYRQMFHGTLAPCLLIDPDTMVIVDANPASCTYYEYTREALLSLKVTDLNPAPPQKIQTDIQEAIDDPTGYYAVQNITATGEVRHLHIYSSPVEVEGKTHLFSIGIDVTEKVRVEEALQKSEALKDAILNTVPDLVMHVDADGTYLDIHTGAPELLIAPKEEMIGKRVTEVLPPHIASSGLERIRKTLETGEMQTAEYFSDRPTGRLWYESRQLPFRDNEVLSIVRDITTEKQLAEQLEDSEARYRNLFEQANDAVLILSLQGAPNVINQRAAELFGYTTEELSGISNKQIIVPEEIEDSILKLERLLAGENISIYERTFVRADGTTFIGEVNISVIRDVEGKPRYLQSVIRDATVRKKMEEQLRKSEERYRSIVDVVAEGILLQDQTGEIIMCNDAAQHILGLQAEDIIGKRVSDPQWQVFDDKDNLLHWSDMATANTLRTGQPHSNVERSIKKIDGSQIHISLNTRALIDTQTQTPYAVVTSFKDITELKIAQQKAFDVAVERERIQIITRFVEDASHEFRTPLSIISTSAYFLERQLTTDNQLTRIQVIDTQIRRIIRLIETLSLMAKLDGGHPMEIGSIALTDLMRRTEYAFKAACEEKQLTMTFSLPDEFIQLCGDAEFLPKALDQIVENAAGHSPEGGAVSVDVQHDTTFVTIRVSDQGNGISEDDLPHVFERFWRDDRAHSEPGFGLGLPIAQKIAEIHQGHITVESIVGQGSTFSIVLPLKPTDAPCTSVMPVTPT